MVLNNKSHKPVKKMAALLLGDTVDLLYVRTDSEDTLPTGDRVSADDRVLSDKLFSNVLRRATRARVDVEIIAFGNFVEAGLRICCGQALQELLVRFGYTVVNLIA